MTADSMGEDPAAEVAAMQAIATALGNLSPAGKVRVLRWAGDLFGAGLSAVAPRVASGGRGGTGDSLPPSPTQAVGEFAELADFYSKANPDSDARKALVVAYWIQIIQGQPDFDTQSVNTELKHLGFGIGNITRAFETLKHARPQLVIQLRKEGSSKQARKRMKVTIEGQREVERLVQGGG